MHAEEIKSHLDNFNLRVISYSPKDDHQELAVRVRDLVELVDAKRLVLADRQSW
jgi:hypothetical protein